MARPKRQKSINVLFIGNSFTSRNDLPGLIAQLATASGMSMQHKLIFAGGASLRAHWNAGKANQEIQTGKYDYVVLQEQSTLPIKNAVRMHENIRLFDEVIKRAGSKTVLYMTWARQHLPETQKAISEAYTSIGKELKSIVVTVGTAWQRFQAKHSKPVLHDRDKSHPSMAGTYFAACIFFEVLFGTLPVRSDIEVTGIDTKDKMLLEKVAKHARPPNFKS
ncbi:MAG: hypothetical protein JNJ77_11380 [Planctomycetia bacterium]|nr:hypothetical protein [Planctomycetia bacterium]